MTCAIGNDDCIPLKVKKKHLFTFSCNNDSKINNNC